MAIYAEAMGRSLPTENVEKHAGELALIERVRQRAIQGRAGTALQLGMGDDCAILRPSAGEELLVTTDFSLEGRHFRRGWHSPESIGYRTLARGLSDLAAMGAKPMAAFLSLALPRSVARDTAWLDGFLDGLLALAGKHRVPLAGGDTSESSSEHVLADIVLLGSAPQGTALRRSGARPGDLLYCTGSLGGAAAELAAVATGKQETERRGRKRTTQRAQTTVKDHPHFFPEPRLRAGQALRQRGLATACIDLSDGLSTDLAHLCAASGVCAEVEAAQLPFHPLAQALGPEEALRAALHGGEDYELLFTARASTKLPRALSGVPLIRIGRILTKPHKGQSRNTPQVTLISEDGARSPLAPGGWEHLR